MKKPLKQNTKALIFSSLFVAVVCVFSQIAIPSFTVPITLQIFAVCICGYFLGVKYGLLTIAVYIISGTIGLPVFYGFQGGAQHILSLTGGFIIGFLPLAFCCGMAHKLKSDFSKILLGIVGVLICHIIGVLQFSFVSSNSLITSFIIASLPYLLKDIPLCVFAFCVAKFISKKIKKSPN